MKHVFLDANIIFGLWRRWVLNHGTLNQSLLIAQHQSSIVCYTSTYALGEVVRNSEIKGVPYTDDQFNEFLKYCQFVIHRSINQVDIYEIYTYDIDDAQILADAVNSDCSVILTNNLKDFNSELIYHTLHIEIIDRL